MKKKIKNASDAIEVLNENLEGILDGTRSLDVAKEVNNTVGKMTGIVKTQLMYMDITRKEMSIAWLDPITVKD